MPGQQFRAEQDRFGAAYERQMVGRFGLGCLLARRLVEAGARYIEVTTEYIPFLNWDTHENGHERLVAMKRQIDAPVAQLVLDLEARGLLNRTLVVLASEFSRDLLIEGKPDLKVKDQVEVPDLITEPKHYGMHRHFTDAGSVLLFGGGVRRGHLHGVTADERPCRTLQGSRRDRGPARDDLPRAGHRADAGVRDRAAAVLRDAGRQGQGDRRRCLPDRAGLAACGTNGWQRRQLIVLARRRGRGPLVLTLVAAVAAEAVAAIHDSRVWIATLRTTCRRAWRRHRPSAAIRCKTNTRNVARSI